MKLYCHSVLANNRSQDNKLIKNACEKIVLNIFFKAQSEMNREIEKILNFRYQGEEFKTISRVLFTGRGENVNSNLELLKEELREKAVKNYSGIQELNLTKLARENSINITRIRDELEVLGGKWFVFNFINRKRIPKELITRVVKEVEFEQREEGLIFRYQIPEKVLNFLVFPDQYASIDMEIIKNLKLKYAIKLYLLVIDHKKRGILELTKQEIMESFSLPASYSKDKNLFLKKFLIPTLKELEEVAKLKLTYSFKKNCPLQGLELKIERKNIVFTKKIFEKIEFVQRNRFIKKSWDEKAHNFLLNYFEEQGEEMTRRLLQSAYEKLTNPIKTTLTNYFLVLSKKLEIDFQEKEVESCMKFEKIQSEESENWSWKYYETLAPSEQKIYKNLARLLFQEKTGSEKIHEEFFRASFKSLISEILEF